MSPIFNTLFFIHATMDSCNGTRLIIIKALSKSTFLFNFNRFMVPMTKEEYEKQQAQVKRVYDPETGRHRWENRQHWGEQIWVYKTASYQLSTHGPHPHTQRFFSFLLIRVISIHCPVILREEKVWKEIIVSSLKHLVNEYFNGMNPLCIWNWEDQHWSRFVSVVTRKTSYWCQWL